MQQSIQQPAALLVLFLTEMWERFGFYIIQGMLVLYLTEALGWSDNQSYAISGAFTAFVYISPIIGGYVADKILGFKLAIQIGGVLLIIGYAALAILSESFLYFSLAIIIVANGLFKPNIASLLGMLYQKEDPRREGGFTLFYMGINLGSMLATLSAGFIKETWGWQASFGVASFGLLLGMLNFYMGARKLQHYGLPPPNLLIKSTWLKKLHSRAAVIIGMVVAVPLLSFLVQYQSVANSLLWVIAVFLIIMLCRLAWQQKEPEIRNRLLALILLAVMSVVFWAIFLQIFFSVNLFIERVVDRQIFGMTIPPIAFISFEALFVVLLAPLLAKLWAYLYVKNKNPSIPLKFFLGFILLAIAFFILLWSTHYHQAGGLIHPAWIPIAYLFITLGELLISPISLAAVTLLSPTQWVGMMMGVYLIGIGYGGKLAGIIATFSSVPAGMDTITASHSYGNAFWMYAILAVAASLGMLILMPLLNRLIKHKKQETTLTPS